MIYFVIGFFVALIASILILREYKGEITRTFKYGDAIDKIFCSFISPLLFIIFALGWPIVVPILIIAVPIMYFYYKLLK